FTNYHIVPTTYTKIASYPSTTDQTIGTNLDTEFYAYVSAEQPAGTYSGKVRFLLIHPNIIDSSTNPATETPSVLPTMQTVSTWGSSVTAGQEVMAVDARDGKFYTVARLADGNLWMTQNLDLDIDSTRTYTSADTDLPANTTWTPNSSTYPTNNNAWAWSEATPESYDPGELYWSGNIDSTYTIQTFDATGNTHYHVGNYYNWTAAVAMNDTASYTVDQTAVDQSICPAGWTLPRPGYGDDTLYSLLSGYSVNTAAINSGSSYHVSSDFNIGGAPTYFTYTGCVASSSGINGANNYGFYWTNVVNSSSSAYDMRSYGSYDNLFNYLSGDLGNGRAFGEPIRCIARPVSSTITFTPE
ncbi:hypothetical protein IK146_01385, partial [Candidatus Saccharibacteria bacterium]|nr:hypothetical protein [Candidatus Saccharibacteria bacterium]